MQFANFVVWKVKTKEPRNLPSLETALHFEISSSFSTLSTSLKPNK
jgi:hypothetical protein